MCKIFNLCVEDDVDQAPIQIPGASNDIFQALKDFHGFDYLSESQAVPSDEKPSASEQPSNLNDVELLGPLDELDKLCMSQSGQDLFNLINESDVQMAESVQREIVPKQEKLEVAPPPDAMLPQHPQVQATTQKRKRRRVKTQEEILMQQERLRCRRKDAARRSRERKADYIHRLEEENQSLQEKVALLEQQLASYRQSEFSMQ